MIIITNTLTGHKEVVQPHRDGTMTLYVCGITPYDYAHLGHGRCYITFDILYRLMLLQGNKVLYCRNFTDIDDKILNRAEKELGNRGEFSVIAERYIKTYHEDMQVLGCLSPTYEPRVTDNIPAIIAFVEELIQAGFGYVVDGDVYFSIDSYPAYGALSKRKLSELIAGARVSVSEKKRNPLDFALWKAESSTGGWQSPWGYGRPGWHIECSALSRTFLGYPIDIHGGGMDLIFPHHENEIAQSQALRPLFVSHWMHNAFVRIDQEKMSKSLGNMITLRDLFARFDPMVIRFFIIQHHYRSPLDFSYEALELAQKSYQKLCKLFAQEQTTLDAPQVHEQFQIGVAGKMLAMVRDDLNTPGMLGVLFEHSKELTENVEERVRVKNFFAHVLGLSLMPAKEESVEITPEIAALMREREDARHRRDWQRADELRAKLRDLGIEVHDKQI